MKDIQYEKYAQLMAVVEELEDKVEALEKAHADAAEIKRAMEALGEARVRLSRVSDGCGPSRAPGA